MEDCRGWITFNTLKLLLPDLAIGETGGFLCGHEFQDRLCLGNLCFGFVEAGCVEAWASS